MKENEEKQDIVRIIDRFTVPDNIIKIMSGICWDGFLGDCDVGYLCRKIAVYYDSGDFRFYFIFKKDTYVENTKDFEGKDFYFCALAAHCRSTKEWFINNFEPKDFEKIKLTIDLNDDDAINILKLNKTNTKNPLCIDNYDIATEYTVEALESLASRMYNDYNNQNRPLIINNSIIQNILRKRARLLNNDFEWTDEYKKKLLKVNEIFMQVFEKAYNEAITIANNLEDRIKNGDDFLMDYEIKIRLDPYISDEYYDDDLKGNNIGYVLSEPDRHYAILTFSFGHSCFKHGKPIYLDKSLNWNIEWLSYDFKDNYICYQIHALIDSGTWSFFDIINIEEIRADIEVIYQHCSESF